MRKTSDTTLSSDWFDGGRGYVSDLSSDVITSHWINSRAGEETRSWCTVGKQEELTCIKWMPSRPPKTERALRANTVIFRHTLIPGLYFCFNAKESRKSQNNMSLWIQLWSSWLCWGLSWCFISHNLWVHFLNLYLSREDSAEHAPPAAFKKPPLLLFHVVTHSGALEMPHAAAVFLRWSPCVLTGPAGVWLPCPGCWLLLRAGEQLSFTTH